MIESLMDEFIFDFVSELVHLFAKTELQIIISLILKFDSADVCLLCIDFLPYAVISPVEL